MEDSIRIAYVAGQLEWPDLDEPSLEDFNDHIRRLNVAVSDLQRHGTELYFALACGRGDTNALNILQRRFFPALDEYLARTGFDASVRQDVFQQMLLHLCAGDAPRIMTYGGRAGLSSWLRVSIYRFALNLAEKHQLPLKGERSLSLEQVIAIEVDPETQVTLERAKPLFQAALQKVLLDLPDRDRTLLRLCYLDGLSIDGIGAMYDVHRATAARWICDVRRRILDAVQHILGVEIGIRTSEFESLARLVHSELHLSLSRILGAA